MIYWQGWEQFVAMGGYGSYVWGSVIVFALALSLEAWSLRGSTATQEDDGT